MNIEPFGEALLKTGDLDPVYFIRKAALTRQQMMRLLIAYWCFYHLGAAAKLSEYEGESFWRAMKTAAHNPKLAWPRASERRHFRGLKCEIAMTWLATVHPEYWVEKLQSLNTDTDIIHEVRGWIQFGPWIAFKAADMMERVLGSKVKFNPNIALLYEEPREALNLLVELRGGTVENAYASVQKHFAKHRAPPLYDRLVGPQEWETILCKWKSHHHGRYTVGKDIIEVRHALAGWGNTAQKLLAIMPKEVTRC